MRTTLGLSLIAVLLVGCSSAATPATTPAPHATTTAPPPPATGAAPPPSTAGPSPGVLSQIPQSSALPPAGSESAPSPSPPVAAAEDLPASFARFAATQQGRVSVAVVPVGSTATPTVLGDPGDPVAWSTSKVPVAIAVEGTPQGPELRPTMRSAITASDNDAAIRLWQSLGSPAEAAAATDRVLRNFGDHRTHTQAEQVRPPYTAFGQTRWSLADQARFAAQLPCRAEAEPVYAAMGNIAPSQQWGLGRLTGSRFKGGWGPSSAGYLVRQFGVVPTPTGRVAVAIAVDAPSFDQGTTTLSRTADWLRGHLGDLSAGAC